LTNAKKVYNQTRLRNLKRASLKYKEKQLEQQIREGIDEKTITQTRKDISNLKHEIKNFKI